MHRQEGRCFNFKVAFFLKDAQVLLSEPV